MKQGRGHLALALAVSLVFNASCSNDSDPEGADESAEGDAVVAACKALCEVQADGDGCSGEPSSSCLGICEGFAERAGECAERTRESFECKQGKAWRCSAGSDQAISTDDLCGAEQDAVSEACEL